MSRRGLSRWPHCVRARNYIGTSMFECSSAPKHTRPCEFYMGPSSPQLEMRRLPPPRLNDEPPARQACCWAGGIRGNGRERLDHAEVKRRDLRAVAFQPCCSAGLTAGRWAACQLSAIGRGNLSIQRRTRRTRGSRRTCGPAQVQIGIELNAQLWRFGNPRSSHRGPLQDRSSLLNTPEDCWDVQNRER